MSLSEYYNYVAHNVPIYDLKYLLVVVLIFYLVVFAFRINGVYKKADCPKCGYPIKRSSKTFADRLLYAALLGILPLRRYKCTSCSWQGLRWNTEKSFFAKKKRRLGRRSSSTPESAPTNFSK